MSLAIATRRSILTRGLASGVRRLTPLEQLELACGELAMPALPLGRLLTCTTSTAVTLYSGQFVAQSEFSVVTTLAPDSGKWNVV